MPVTVTRYTVEGRSPDTEVEVVREDWDVTKFCSTSKPLKKTLTDYKKDEQQQYVRTRRWN